jgi:hypothetical protein
MHLVHFAKESVFYFLALIMGMIAYKNLRLFYRILFWQCVLNVLQYTTAYWVTGALHIRNNHWVFNVYIVLECTLLLWAALLHFHNRLVARIAIIGYFLFICIFVWQMLEGGLFNFAHHAACMEGLLLVFVYLFLLYKLFAVEVAGDTLPAKWLCIGIVTYFGCTIPYLSMLYYLQHISPRLNFTMHDSIIVGAENLRYLCTTVCFFLVMRKRVSTAIAPHE